MLRVCRQLGLVMALLCIYLPAQSKMAAKFYIYQLPDGSRLVSDRPVKDKSYKLITTRTTVDGIGYLAANKGRFRKPQNIDKWDKLIVKLSRRHRVDTALVKAVIHTESSFDHMAVSHRGASGLMQLMPRTAAMYGVRNIHDPYENIDAGIKHLRYLIQKYEWNLRHALAAYNAGEQAVRKYNGIPPYKETQEYVNKVLRYRDLYRRVYY